MRTLGKIIGLMLISTLAATGAAAGSAQVWRDAFGSSPAHYAPVPDSLLSVAAARRNVPLEQIREEYAPKAISGTVRYRVKLTAAGAQLRVRLSNEQGDAPLRLNGATVALAGEGFSSVPGSMKPLTFGGSSVVTIALGAPLVSDPVALPVRPGTVLVVSAAMASPLPVERNGSADFVYAPGDQTARETLERATPITGRPLVSGISVLTAPSTRVIVAFGDSITDANRGPTVTPDSWPNRLAQRLSAASGKASYSVVNAGIGGNRLLVSDWGPAGLARLDRDALRIEGLSHLVLLEGTNDIGLSGVSAFGNNPDITAEELIAGYRQVITRAHERGVKVILGTLTPIGGALAHSSPHKDAIHEQVNAWIRTSREADGVIDFERILRDPANPTRFLPAFDSGDHLHPNDAGYKAMGDGIDLNLFR